MLYLCIVLFLIIVLLAAQIYQLYQSLSEASKQMEEIEEHPERNRQLKAISANKWMEKLLERINTIYLARQQERIIYQRRETQIRREIENISHDLRTPLTSIIGYVDLIQDNTTSQYEKEEYLRIIHKRARVLQGFIQDFYELSRIEGDDYPLLIDRIPIQTMIRESAVAYYHEFEKKKIQVSIELEEDQCFLMADKIQLNRILNNLIQNALKYASTNFIIKQYTFEKQCILQFKNDMTKISKEDLNLIFDRFYTGDSNRSNGSSGLGLTITKILVEKMKGRIEARLEETMFVIELQWPL